MKSLGTIICLLLLLGLNSCGVATSRESQARAALNLSRSHFKYSVTIKDGPLDTVITFSTINGVKERRGLLGIVWDDNFLRAFIDKKSGTKTFQVYNSIYYGGRWKFFTQANYETPDGPKSTTLTIIDRRVVDCSDVRLTGGCNFNEHVAFLVDEKLLRWIGEADTVGQPIGWRYKLSARSGDDYQDGLLPAEIGGLLDRMDEYLATRGIGNVSVSPEIKGQWSGSYDTPR